MEEIFDRVEGLLETLERQLLTEHPFAMFRLEPSVCDLYLFNELIQLNLIGFDLSEKPNTLRYVNRVARVFPRSIEVCSELFTELKKRNIKLYIESMVPSL